MTTNEYEKLYKCVRKCDKPCNTMNYVVEYLQNADTGVSVKDLVKYICGTDNRDVVTVDYTFGSVRWALRKLKKANLVHCYEVHEGEPRTWTTEEWVGPRVHKVKATLEDGRVVMINDPDNPWEEGHFEKKTHTAIPKVKKWVWGEK